MELRPFASGNVDILKENFEKLNRFHPMTFRKYLREAFAFSISEDETTEEIFKRINPIYHVPVLQKIYCNLIFDELFEIEHFDNLNEDEFKAQVQKLLREKFQKSSDIEFKKKLIFFVSDPKFIDNLKNESCWVYIKFIFDNIRKRLEEQSGKRKASQVEHTGETTEEEKDDSDEYTYESSEDEAIDVDAQKSIVPFISKDEEVKQRQQRYIDNQFNDSDQKAVTKEFLETFKFVECGDSGDCQYQSFAYLLDFTDPNHDPTSPENILKIREKMVNFLASKNDAYIHRIYNNICAFENKGPCLLKTRKEQFMYLTRLLLKEQSFGNMETLQLLHEMQKVNIKVIKGYKRYVNRIPEHVITGVVHTFENPAYKKWIYLFYVNDNHFQAIQHHADGRNDKVFNKDIFDLSN